MHFHKNICKKNLTRNNILKKLNVTSRKQICLRFSNYWNSKSKQIKSHQHQLIKTAYSMCRPCQPWRRFRASLARKKTCHFCMKMLYKPKISSTTSARSPRSKLRAYNSININLKIRVNSCSRRRNKSSSRVFTASPLFSFSPTQRYTSSSSPNSYLSSNKIRPSSLQNTHNECNLNWINITNNKQVSLQAPKMAKFSRIQSINNKWFFKITALCTNSQTPPQKTTCISEQLTK